MTPEQIKAERQLSWMKANLPPIPGDSIPLIAKRRKVLVKILMNIDTDPDGCLIYRSNSTHSPLVKWPIREKFSEDRRERPRQSRYECMWPGGCRRKPAKRKSVTAKHPLYCLQPDPVTGDMHDGMRAAAYRIRVDKPAPLTLSKVVSKLILSLYSPGQMEGVRGTRPSCGKLHCVSPSHQYNVSDWWRDNLVQNGSKIREKHDRDTVLEVIRLRCDELLTYEEIRAKTGVTIGVMRGILRGRVYTRHTEGLLSDGRAEIAEQLIMERGRARGAFARRNGSAGV